MHVDWSMIGALITAIAAILTAWWSLTVLHERDREYVSILVLLNRDLEDATFRADIPDSCLPLALPALDLVLARGFARRWPPRLRDRLLTIRSVMELVNLDNDLLWRAAFGARAASGGGKPPEIIAVERDRKEKLAVVKASIAHILADDLGPLLKKKRVKPGACDPMWESVVSQATAGPSTLPEELGGQGTLQGGASRDKNR